ncbi:uncharacterized protein LOC125213132 [Salvia hispanica]|uniref:uncharacterized protein LOC125213132 n=1 Tax=Salvia hispanica TaxID=49212 RepID=UPI0020090B37|nr:uncharacterized protein LOC125213132 [Salvia hispanica]
MCPASVKPGQDPFKALKLIPKEKTGDALTTSLKAAVAVISILSISLAAYSAIHDPTQPELFARPDPAQFGSDDTPTNVSHLAFGIGGSTATWANRARYSDLWWKPGSTRGYVFLERDPAGSAGSGVERRVSSEWRRFRRTKGPESAVRMARVVADLYRVGLPGVRWFVMGDDDTVFFPENLAAVLGRHDHRRMVYVGGNSESVEQDVEHSYEMAFGGGGFAVSYPLAAELAAAMDGCLDRYHYFYGSDQRVWACVGELGVGLTREPGFHQTDIRGDPFGFLAAHPLAPLVSLHHLDSIQPLLPNHTQFESVTALMKAYEADPPRTLQQCFCYHRNHNWSVSVSWGYAVQIFPALLTAKELEMPQQTFKTWRTFSSGPFTFNTRPLSSDPCKRPAVFFLSSAEEEGSEGTITAYRKAGDRVMSSGCNKDFNRAMAIENVTVLAPKMEQQEWDQSPRRHCCDIDGNLRHRTMRIRIRRCGNSETITI